MLPIIIQQPSTNTWIDLMTVIIPAGVTIIGFVINYFVLNKSIKDQVSKKKTDISLEFLSKAPLLSLELFDNIREQKQDKMLEIFIELANTVFAYGSKDAIKILAELQQNNYKIAINSENKDLYKTMAYYIILTCQIKGDLTGIKINPEFWYKLKLNDYGFNPTVKQGLINATNQVVEELQLEDYLKIDE